MYKIYLALILAITDVSLGNQDDCGWIGPHNMKIEQLKNELLALQLKLAESRYKDDLIKSLKETIDIQKSKCQSKDTGSDEKLLKKKLKELRKEVESYKKTYGEVNSLQANSVDEKLKDCQAEVRVLERMIKDKEGSLGGENNGLAELKETSCVSFKYSTGKREIYIPGIEPFNVLCDGRTGGPGWTVIQRRFDGSVEFYRNWNEYKNGFGSLDGEFFIGLEKLHHLTNYKQHELYVNLENFNGEISYARYDYVIIGSEAEKYELVHLGYMTGNAGDFLQNQKHMKFSTYDQDNDNWADGNCAIKYHCGWWCTDYVGSNLNGRYFHNEIQHKQGLHWRDLSSSKAVSMLIRPKN